MYQRMYLLRLLVPVVSALRAATKITVTGVSLKKELVKTLMRALVKTLMRALVIRLSVTKIP
jgi:Arc/MetJ family transcription regulator